MNISPQPTVSARLMTRTDPVLEIALCEIKESIAEDGFYSVTEYKECIVKYGIPDETMLPMLPQSGFSFIKTFAANQDLEQEVIIDLRYIAAAMLLIYSDPNFAKHNSVLKYLHVLHKLGTWRAAFPVILLPGLLNDIYGAYGHHFTVASIADNADLSKEDETLITKFAIRHNAAIFELSNNDNELTEVFRLCVDVMAIVNNGDQLILGKKVVRNLNNPKAYNYFKRAAMKIIDKHNKNICNGK